MVKFNYLLQSLVGKARQTAAQFKIIEENYPIVIDLLKKKYGSNSLIVEELLAQLEQIRADGSNTRQQANLLERITALLMQLSTKGQDNNHRLVLDMVLRKFNGDIQAKALEKWENLEHINQWTWSALRQHLSVIID
uniref:Bacteriocin immunity protein n=1 Tax=Haemonchus contortus TaxID=6289 RepID=A0A7I4YEA1_HAECO